MRRIAVSTGPAMHLDHLGVLASELSIPMVVTDRAVYASGKKWYPTLNIVYKEIGELTPEFFAQYEMIFESNQHWSFDLSQSIELLFQKKVRFVYCPHGNSDKGAYLPFHCPQDIVLLYGRQMYDLLEETGALKNIKDYYFIGNYRYNYYLKHRSFYDNLLEEELLFPLDKAKKTILYAPTWHTQETPSSFFTHCTDLVCQLPDSFQLIVKLHPFLEEKAPAETLKILGQCKPRENLLFLSESPSIYPLLARSDIYIGDFSSIGYDFLTFNRPIYFFDSSSKKSSDRTRFLHQCGYMLPRDKIFSFIEKTLEKNQRELSSLRQKIYKYSFES